MHIPEVSLVMKQCVDEMTPLTSEALDAYNMSKLELDSQEIGCSRKADAFYCAQSATPTTANKSPLEADVEQSEKHQRPCCVNEENIGQHKFGCLRNVICQEPVGLEQGTQAVISSCAATRVREVSGGGSVYQEKSGRWKARIQIRKVRHILGSFATAEDAREALNQKKCELGLKTDAEQNLIQRHAYPNKKGRWYTEIRHPTTKARIHLGTFDTADEAQEAYNSKRREFDLMFPGHKESKQSNNTCDLGSKVDAEQSENTQRRPHVYLNASGRWRTQISHPITKAKVHLGTFDTAEEAEEAYDSKKREFNLMFPSVPGRKKRKQLNNRLDLCLKGDSEQSEKNQRRLQTQIGNPITKARVDAGTFDTAEKDEEACNNKRLEFENRKQLNNSYDLDLKADAEHCERTQRQRYAYRSKSGRWYTEIRHPISRARLYLGTFDSAEEAEEANNNKRREFDLLFPDQKKHKESNASFKSDAIAEGKSDPTSVSDVPTAFTNGSSQIKACREEETGGSMMNVNVDSVLPMLVTGKNEESDLGIIDSYGRLLGEYNRLDDELWFCKSEDVATLERGGEGHKC